MTRNTPRSPKASDQAMHRVADAVEAAVAAFVAAQTPVDAVASEPAQVNQTFTRYLTMSHTGSGSRSPAGRRRRSSARSRRSSSRAGSWSGSGRATLAAVGHPQPVCWSSLRVASSAPTSCASTSP